MEQFVPPVGRSARVVNFGVGEALPPVRLRRFAYLPLSAGERSPGIGTFPPLPNGRGPRGPPTGYPLPGEVSVFVTIQEKAMPGPGK
jgi:hypothetical protein